MKGQVHMQKFFIVKNEQYLREIEEYKRNIKSQSDFIKTFFASKEINGDGYYMRGDGSVNAPFTERGKNRICLYIDDCESNNERFGAQLKKARRFDDGNYLRAFRKDSSILKEFQNLCIEKEIVINVHYHREGDYFKELHLGGYSARRFFYEGDFYLSIESGKESITPESDGFVEIKGSEFYQAFEKFEEKLN